MNATQSQIVASFAQLDTEQKAVMLKILVAHQRAATNAGLNATNCGFKVGERVRLNKVGSEFVSKVFWGKEYEVTKVTDKHLYLSAIDSKGQPKTLWPLLGDCTKVQAVEAVTAPSGVSVSDEDAELAAMIAEDEAAAALAETGLDIAESA